MQVGNSWLGIKQTSKVWLLKLQYGVMQVLQDFWACWSTVTQNTPQAELGCCFGPPIPETPGLLAHDRNNPLLSAQLSPRVTLQTGHWCHFSKLHGTNKKANKKKKLSNSGRTAVQGLHSIFYCVGFRPGKVLWQVWPVILQMPHGKRKNDTTSLTFLWYSVTNTLKSVTKPPAAVTFYCAL